MHVDGFSRTRTPTPTPTPSRPVVIEYNGHASTTGLETSLGKACALTTHLLRQRLQ